MYNGYGSSSDPTAALGSFLSAGTLCLFLFAILVVVFEVYVFYKIFQKTGNSGWLALFMLLPIVNFVMVLFLAFSDWPVLRENRAMRDQLGYGAPTGYPPAGGGYSGYSAPQAPYVPPTQPTYTPPPAAYPPPPQPPAQPGPPPQQW